MHREGRQRGWVRTHDVLDLLVLGHPGQEEGIQQHHRRKAVPATATVANGGFVRAPRRPTNQSKPSGLYKELGGKGDGSSWSGKGRRKFRHNELKTYYLELADDGYDMD